MDHIIRSIQLKKLIERKIFNMWIRTQDKEMIMNCNAVGIGLEEQTTIWSGGYVLGTYSTKEKALKVLDMIEDRINQNEEFAAQGERNAYGTIRLMKFVYQMPLDSEVE